jgi:hypothetical protein
MNFSEIIIFLGEIHHFPGFSWLNSPFSLGQNCRTLDPEEDPWQDILNARDAGGFCEVPRSLLRQLRREGEAATV